MRDFGAMNLAMALVHVVAGVTMNRLLVRTALCALLLFAIPHLIFHATHREHFSAVGRTGPRSSPGCAEFDGKAASRALRTALLSNSATAGQQSAVARTASVTEHHAPGGQGRRPIATKPARK
jgi:hypothetical protein